VIARVAAQATGRRQLLTSAPTTGPHDSRARAATSSSSPRVGQGTDSDARSDVASHMRTRGSKRGRVHLVAAETTAAGQDCSRLSKRHFKGRVATTVLHEARTDRTFTQGAENQGSRKEKTRKGS